MSQSGSSAEGAGTTCPWCSAATGAGMSRCAKCGAELSRRSAAAAAVATQPLLDYAPEKPVQNPHIVQRDYASAAVEHCAYCQAPLDPFYYFCLRCSKPYKQLESVTGGARPMPLTDTERVKRMAPHTWTVFWTYAWVLIGCLVMTLFWPRKDGSTELLEFLGTMAIFVTTVIFACIHWRPLVAQFKAPGFNKWEAWAGLGMLVPLLLVNFGMHVATKYMFHGEREQPDSLPLVAGIFLVCVFPAITEEIAFRGLLSYWLEVSITPAKALMLSSAMFAALHLNLLGFPYLFTVGLTLALVRRRTGSLYPGMLIHFLHNLVVITVFPLF